MIGDGMVKGITLKQGNRNQDYDDVKGNDIPILGIKSAPCFLTIAGAKR